MRSTAVVVALAGSVIVLAALFAGGGQSGCGSVGAPASGSLTPASVVTYLQGSVPMTAVAAAGVEGNLQQESSLNPADPGGGLAQWINSPGGPRYTEMVTWVTSHGMNPASAQGQLAYLANDLQTAYYGLAQEMDAATSPADAAIEFETNYEAAGDPKMGNRIAYATLALQAAGGSTTVPVSDPIAAVPCAAPAGEPVSAGGYIDPLRFVNVWERTDMGVDATLPVGAPILAPGEVKILGPCPSWYLGQPFISWQLLSGSDAGQYQYVAEQITNLAVSGAVLQQGQTIADYAPSGTGIEYGWATPVPCQTLAQGTTGYVEGEFTPAGENMRAWLNALGAGAGPNHH
ncbi:MAG: phage tail tip lysozyme [Solirubrobacteraceae bacterium]